MAIVSHSDADRYIQRPNRHHFLILIFGSDHGLVSERSQMLARSARGGGRESLQLIDFAGDLIASDPLSLIDEANAISLFGGAGRVIRIAIGNKSLLPALELIAQAPPTDCLIILEAGELKRDAPLRKWIENKPFAVSIECRGDDAKDIQRLIDTELKVANLSIDPDARDALGAMLGEDRLSTRSELSKLFLFTHGQSSITLEHINEILHDASALNIDAVITAIFSGRPTETIELANKAMLSGVDTNVLVANTLRYATALHRGRAEIDKGGPFEDTLQTILRQFSAYSRKSEVAAHLRNTPRGKLEAIVTALHDIVKKSRKNSYLADESLTRLFLAFALSLKRN
jgi:DNA polymerase III subunit delta